MTFNEVEAIEKCPIGQDMLWSTSSLGIGDEEFDALFGRLEQHEALGRIAIAKADRESYSGQRFFVRVKFRRLA